MEKVFEKLSKVKKAKLRNGDEYQWSATVYNPGTGEFTLCGYWKDEKKWKFIYHNEDGIYLYDGSKSSYDIVLEEPEQWVNVVTFDGVSIVNCGNIYDSKRSAVDDQDRICYQFKNNKYEKLSVFAKKLSNG